MLLTVFRGCVDLSPPSSEMIIAEWAKEKGRTHNFIFNDVIIKNAGGQVST